MKWLKDLMTRRGYNAPVERYAPDDAGRLEFALSAGFERMEAQHGEDRDALYADLLQHDLADEEGDPGEAVRYWHPFVYDEEPTEENLMRRLMQGGEDG